VLSASTAALTDEPVLSSACAWLCKRGRGYPPCADMWNFRRHWPDEKRSLSRPLLAGRLANRWRATALSSGTPRPKFTWRAKISALVGSPLRFRIECVKGGC